MDSQEFRKEFMETVKAAAFDSGEGASASFVGEMARYLVEAEVLPDFVSAFYCNETSRRKKYRVDGYVLDEFDNTMNLVIADYSGDSDRTMGKSLSTAVFQRLEVFVEEALRGQLHREIEMSTPCADLVDLLRSREANIRRFRFLIFTDAIVSETLKNLDSLEVCGFSTELQIWDIDRMFRVCCSDLGRQSIEIDFCDYVADGIPCLEATNASTRDYKSFLSIIPGSVLADIYDKYGSQLLEGNVRSFLSTKVAVNKKIRETILRCPSRFFAYNNGISATAIDVRVVATSNGYRIVGARDFQIINGGQTTASLSNARHKDKVALDDIFVQMKLTEIDAEDVDKSTELVRNISRSSNSQNKVTDADFFSTHPFHVRMEQHSRRVYAPATDGAQYETIWFYERAKGQYLQAQMRLTPAKKRQFALRNPKKQVITKTDLAKVRNTWAELPQVVSKGAQTNFMKFAELIDEAWNKDDAQFNEKYYKDTVALVIIFKQLELLIPKQSWYEQGYRANVVTYTMALLHKLIRTQFPGKELDLAIVWQKQSVPIELVNELTRISELVYSKITDPSRQTINVTQWCKRDACWQAVQDLQIDLPPQLEAVLIEKGALRYAERESKKDQKFSNGVDAQKKVLEYDKEQWLALLAFCQEKGIAATVELNALTVACQIPAKLPNSVQCQRVLALLERAMSEGFKM